MSSETSKDKSESFPTASPQVREEINNYINRLDTMPQDDPANRDNLASNPGVSDTAAPSGDADTPDGNIPILAGPFMPASRGVPLRPHPTWIYPPPPGPPSPPSSFRRMWRQISGGGPSDVRDSPDDRLHRRNLPVSVDEMNNYSDQKSYAKGLVDIARLTANANQLRYMAELQDPTMKYVNIAFITISIILQVILLGM